MKKGLFKAGAVIVSLCFFAAITGFVRRYFARDSFSFTRFDVPAEYDHGYLTYVHEVISSHGNLCIAVTNIEDRNPAGYDSQGNQISRVDPTRSTKFSWSGTSPELIDYDSSPRGWRAGWAGFEVGFESYLGTGAGSDIHYLIVPYWMLILPLGLVALIYIIRRHNHQIHQSQGLCGYCGYDLRATFDRCPECGTLAAVKKPVSIK